MEFYGLVITEEPPETLWLLITQVFQRMLWT